MITVNDRWGKCRRHVPLPQNIFFPGGAKGEEKFYRQKSEKNARELLKNLIFLPFFMPKPSNLS